MATPAPAKVAAVPAGLTPANALALQRLIGNAAVTQMASDFGVPAAAVEPDVEIDPLAVGTELTASGGLAPTVAPAAQDGAPPAVDGGATRLGTGEGGAGKAGQDVYHGAHEGHGHGGATPDLSEGPKNEFGEMDGRLDSGVRACVFIDGGRTGAGAVHWGGGTGGLGGQSLGDITLVAPVYDSGVKAGTPAAQGKAWIRPGTGTATVTRSFTGVLTGANGPNYYFTAAASARIDVHERLHIAATRAEHQAHIVPLEQRVAQHTGENNALLAGTTGPEAVTALQTFINWNAAIQAFRTGDTTQNTPGPPLGPVDSADKNSGTYVQDYGARTVGGTAYAHYIDVPPGPPAPPPAPATPPAAGGP